MAVLEGWLPWGQPPISALAPEVIVLTSRCHQNYFPHWLGSGFLKRGKEEVEGWCDAALSELLFTAESTTRPLQVSEEPCTAQSSSKLLQGAVLTPLSKGAVHHLEQCEVLWSGFAPFQPVHGSSDTQRSGCPLDLDGSGGGSVSWC